MRSAIIAGIFTILSKKIEESKILRTDKRTEQKTADVTYFLRKQTNMGVKSTRTGAVPFVCFTQVPLPNDVRPTRPITCTLDPHATQFHFQIIRSILFSLAIKGQATVYLANHSTAQQQSSAACADSLDTCAADTHARTHVQNVVVTPCTNRRNSAVPSARKADKHVS